MRFAVVLDTTGVVSSVESGYVFLTTVERLDVLYVWRAGDVEHWHLGRGQGRRRDESGSGVLGMHGSSCRLVAFVEDPLYHLYSIRHTASIGMFQSASKLPRHRDQLRGMERRTPTGTSITCLREAGTPLLEI